MIDSKDIKYLEHCVELAETALENGDAPFGSVLVSEKDEVLFEDHNHTSSGDQTQHPEFAIARWAANNMEAEERKRATVYTSGEHCPMCSAAHGLVGLGRIVYASSSAQLVSWQEEMGTEGSPIHNLPIEEVIQNAVVDGPEPELAQKVKELHVKANQS